MPKRKFIDNKTSCSKCKELKDVSEFYFRSDKKHLLQSSCKSCVSRDSIASGLKYIDRLKSRQSEYHKENRDRRLLQSREYNKRVYKSVRVAKDKERYRTDLNFRMKQNLCNRIRTALKRNSKASSSHILIGCSIGFLKTHLESLFTEGMSWDNYGKWQIDHIRPCSSFDLSIPEHQLVCFNYKNLQPLWALDNLIKKDKIEKEVCHR